MAKKDKERKYKVSKWYLAPRRPYMEKVEAEVQNQKELLALPWVKEATRKARFKRFTVAEDEGECPNTKYLMVEDDLCDWWEPVAIIPKDFPHTLPHFKEVKDKIIQDG
jgi:hypothetical protein